MAPCGCGSSNKYKPPTDKDGKPQAAPATGLPKVWNGPKPLAVKQ